MSSGFFAYFQNLPPMFLGSRLDDLTDGLFSWKNIKNLRSKRHIPETCFLKISPRKILIRRDAFLAWAEEYAILGHKNFA